MPPRTALTPPGMPLDMKRYRKGLRPSEDPAPVGYRKAKIISVTSHSVGAGVVEIAFVENLAKTVPSVPSISAVVLVANDWAHVLSVGDGWLVLGKV